MYNSLFFDLYFYNAQNLSNIYLSILLNEKVKLAHSEYGFTFSIDYCFENLNNETKAKQKYLELLKLENTDFSFYLYFDNETVGTSHIFCKEDKNKISVEFLRPKILLNTNMADVSYYSILLNSVSKKTKSFSKFGFDFAA